MRRARLMGRNAALLGGGAALVLLGARAWMRRGKNLAGQVALVTGSSRGLGFLLAREFARNGCRVVICARDKAELDRARTHLEQEEGAEVFAYPCDVTDRGQVDELVRQAIAHFGRVDILVNNAGKIAVGPLDSMHIEDFEQALAVMFWGVLYPTLTVLPDMLRRGAGRIVNITSVGGKVSVPHLLPYSCAKFAAVGLSEGLRAELKKDGIRVTTIVPGLMRTGSFLNAEFKGQQENEYRMFGLGAALPFVSMDAERAARQIVAATRRGSSERILSLPATAMARFHGVFPGLTAEILSLVGRLLPRSSESESAPGREVHQRARSRVFTALTGLGFSAAERFHQYPGPAAG